MSTVEALPGLFLNLKHYDMAAKYINGIGTTAKDKSQFLIDKAQAAELFDTPIFRQNLICVLDCGPYGAAKWIDSEAELNYTLGLNEQKRWFVVPDISTLIPTI